MTGAPQGVHTLLVQAIPAPNTGTDGRPSICTARGYRALAVPCFNIGSMLCLSGSADDVGCSTQETGSCQRRNHWEQLHDAIFDHTMHAHPRQRWQMTLENPAKDGDGTSSEGRILHAATCRSELAANGQSVWQNMSALLRVRQRRVASSRSQAQLRVHRHPIPKHCSAMASEITREHFVLGQQTNANSNSLFR